MIIYESAKLHPARLLQWTGSVMPFSFAVALPCAICTVGLKLLPQYFADAESAWSLLSLEDSSEKIAGAAFSGVNFLIGFLVVFRSSQAYNRFWEGLSSLNEMQGEWWDAASSLCAFCKCSTCPHKEVILFQHTLLRLISMLNGCVLMELSAGFHRDHVIPHDSKRAFELELIDAEGIDNESLRSVNASAEKIELVFQWIQQLVVESDAKEVFSVSGPVLSRAFQELSNGMVQYRQASKIARTPLPFPYMQATELLLISHWLCTPVLMCIWVESPVWAGILSFIQVMFYWSLNSIATELENPFGEDANDLPAKEIQQDFNKRLLLLIRPGTVRTARLSKEAAFEETQDAKEGTLRFGRQVTLGQDGINNKDGLMEVKRRGSLEENRITWGTLQFAIQERISTGYTSERDSDEGLAATLDAQSSAWSKLQQHVAPPRIRSQNPSRAASKDLQTPTSRTNGSKDLPPFGADVLHTKDGSHLGPLLDTERVERQLACLASLPELLLVCTDVRNQLKELSAAEEVVKEAEGAPTPPAKPVAKPSMPRVAEGLEAPEVAVEARLQAQAVHRALGRELGSGCLGVGCSSTRSTSRV